MRCAFCHDHGERLVSCAGCGTRLHEDCWALADHCPTLGCARAGARRPRPVRIAISSRPARRRWPAVAAAAAFLLAIGGTAFAQRLRPPPAMPYYRNDLEPILALGKQGEERFREWNRARVLGDPHAPRLLAEAKEKLQRASEQLQALLEQPQYRSGDRIKPDYEGYESYLQRWCPRLTDLELARDFERDADRTRAVWVGSLREAR